ASFVPNHAEWVESCRGNDQIESLVSRAAAAKRKGGTRLVGERTARTNAKTVVANHAEAMNSRRKIEISLDFHGVIVRAVNVRIESRNRLVSAAAPASATKYLLIPLVIKTSVIDFARLFPVRVLGEPPVGRKPSTAKESLAPPFTRSTRNSSLRPSFNSNGS